MSSPPGSGFHPSDQTLRRFLRAELPGMESDRLVDHLLSGCRPCAQLAAGLWRREIALRGAPPTERTGRPGARAPQTIRLHGRVAERERSEASSLLAELEAHPPPRQIMLVSNSHRFRTLALTRCLQQRVFELGLEDPRRALAVAEVALAVADRLSEARYGRELVRDFQGRTWSTVANARRIAGDLPGAERGFQRAEKLLEEGTGDPAERAAWMAHKALLRAAQRRFAHSRRLLDRALRAYRSVGDLQGVARTRITKGGVFGDSGELELAVRTLTRGLGELDQERERRTALVAKHNLIHFLLLDGRPQEAAALLPEARAEHEALGNALDLLRLQWLEAKLELSLGRLRDAEAGLIEVIDGFVEREMPYPAAIAVTDLAQVYLAQNRTAEIPRLVNETLSVFRSLRIEREALAALTLLARAVRRERLTRRRIEIVARLLSAGSGLARPRPTAGVSRR